MGRLDAQLRQVPANDLDFHSTATAGEAVDVTVEKEAADHVRRVLPKPLERYQHVWFLTHVPPWREACWHEGRQSDENWTPHFACGAVGEALTEIMAEHSDRQLTVLCGHTHGDGETQVLPNLLAITGGAEYGRPTVQKVFEVG